VLPLTCVAALFCRLVNRLNAEHGVPDFVEFYEAAGGMPAVYLMHPRGHTLEIHLQVGIGSEFIFSPIMRAPCCVLLS
jgi:hypothetical protein